MCIRIFGRKFRISCHPHAVCAWHCIRWLSRSTMPTGGPFQAETLSRCSRSLNPRRTSCGELALGRWTSTPTSSPFYASSALRQECEQYGCSVTYTHAVQASRSAKTEGDYRPQGVCLIPHGKQASVKWQSTVLLSSCSLSLFSLFQLPSTLHAL